MRVFYSATTKGFYQGDLSRYASPPSDLVEVTEEYREYLLAGQSKGKEIVSGEDGRPFLADPPPPTEQQQIKIYEKAVQLFMDHAAQEHGYDSVATAVSYAEEPSVPKYQSDGRAFREWRSLVWAYCYAQLDAYKAGTIEKPTVEQLIAGLPALSIQTA